jgi:hypothetical protein
LILGGTGFQPVVPGILPETFSVECFSVRNSRRQLDGATVMVMLACQAESTGFGALAICHCTDCPDGRLSQ